MMKKGLQVLMIFMFSFAFSQNEKEQVAKPERVISTDRIYTITDVPADFPGGLMKFRQEFGDSFDPNAIKEKGKFNCELTFVISENGQISNVNAKGNNPSFNNEAKKALNSMKNKIWKPGKINGEPVKSRYRIPFNMVFE